MTSPIRSDEEDEMEEDSSSSYCPVVQYTRVTSISLTAEAGRGDDAEIKAVANTQIVASC